jgi:HlyD family secretion protein
VPGMTTLPALTCDGPHPRIPGDGAAELPPRTERHDPRAIVRGRRRRAALVSGMVVGMLALVAVAALWRADATQSSHDYVYYAVRPVDLPITVTERGTLESQNNVQIICEVDDVPGDGVHGTSILWIVENGVSVQKGDLLVDLDAAPHQERLDRQILDTEQARARAIQARVNFENRVTRNETALAKAQLAVDMALLALHQYEDEHGGTYQIQLQNVELAMQERQAQADIEARNLRGMQHLNGLGYRSKSDLDEAKLKALRSKNELDRQTSRRRELTVYNYRKQKLTLEGAYQSAQRTLQQVRVENQSLLAQAEAWKVSAEYSLEREEERLAQFRAQLEKCKIYAPQNGMVAYHVESNGWGQSSSIAAGTAVRDRQPLMSIPDLTRMQVKTAVHESVVDRIKPDVLATIRLDAFPDRVYRGHVKSVAVLPDPGGWLSSNAKVYETIVTIDEELQHLKPGMTAVVELQLDHLSDVLSVPVQAIVQQRDSTWCYVAERGRVQRRDVKLGKTNDKFVQICDGLQAGDQVILNPSAVLDEAPDQQPPLTADVSVDKAPDAA